MYGDIIKRMFIIFSGAKNSVQLLIQCFDIFQEEGGKQQEAVKKKNKKKQFPLQKPWLPIFKFNRGYTNLLL